jgi:hypothetical protein
MLPEEETGIINLDAETVEEAEEATASEETTAEEGEKEEEAKAEAEEGAEEEADEAEPEKPGEEQSARFKELAYRRRVAEREAREERERTRQLAERLAVLEAKDKPPKQPDQAGPPKQDDYDDFGKYLDDLTDYKVNQRMAEQNQQTAVQQRQAKAEQAQAAAVTKAQSLAEQGREAFEDFDEVVFESEWSQTETMVAAMLDSESEVVAAKVAYHLASNPKEADKISRMSPARQVKAIGALEGTLSAPPKKKVTKAKAPVKAAGGDSAGSRKLSYEEIDKLPLEEFNRLRREGKI